MDAPGVFLATMFDEVLDAIPDSQICLFTLPNKQARFYSTSRSAAKVVEYWAERDEQNIYVGAGVYRSGITKGRGKAADVLGISSLWIDVDVAVPGVHGGKKYPPDKETAREILEHDIPWAKPTYLIDSGNGLQAWYRFDEPIRIDDATGGNISAVLQRWTATVSWHYAQHGYEIDTGTWDLSRVLRVPGTWNYKSGKKPVRIVAANDSRLTLDEVSDYFVSPEPKDVLPKPQQGATLSAMQDKVAEAHGDFILRFDPPSEVLDAAQKMQDADPAGFGATWQRKRQKTFGLDCNRYLMSLANYGVMVGQSNQWIVDLLVHFQRRWQQGVDASRPVDKHEKAWYVRILYKARFDLPTKESDQVVDLEVEQAIDEGGDKPRQALRDLLELPSLERIEQHGRDRTGVSYYLVMRDGDRYSIGGSDVPRRPELWIEAIAAASGSQVILSSSIIGKWRNVQKLLQHVTVVIDEDSEAQEQLNEYLSRYLRNTTVVSDPEKKDRKRVADERDPFVEEGNLYVHPSRFAYWLRTVDDLRDVKREVIVNMLRRCKWESARVNATGTSYRYYVMQLDNLGIDVVALTGKETRKR